MIPFNKSQSIFFIVGLLATVTAFAEVKTGDTYAQVLEQKGLPTAKIESGATHLLRYPDSTIKLKAGVVIAVEKSKPLTAARVPSPPSPSAVNKPAPPSLAPATPLVWQTDYAAALAQAKAENRQVFLFFTGSDWCGWCIRLNKEILSTPEFARYAQEKLILVELDFPRSHPQPAPLKAQNAKLAKRYSIRGYPTVIVLDASGKKTAEMGYQEGGPAPFIASLDKL